MDFDIQAFREAVERHWENQYICNHMHWVISKQDEAEVWQFEVAPAFQEIFGGNDDGKLTWTPFAFDLNGFFHELGMEIEDFACISLFQDKHGPFIALKGTYWGASFAMTLTLEPIPNSEPIEVYDTLTNEVRLKEKP